MPRQSSGADTPADWRSRCRRACRSRRRILVDARSLPPYPLSSRIENIGIMTRFLFLRGVAASLLLAAAGVAAAAVVRGNLVFDNIPELRNDSADTLDDYLSAREAKPLGWSPKGQLLIVTRFGDVDQLHVVEHAGGERRQLTFLREPVTQGAFSPDPSRGAYLYLKDVGGNENTQLHYHSR